MVTYEDKESRYLSVDELDSTDSKEDREKIAKARKTDNEATLYLYNMHDNMKLNEKYRASMSEYAKKAESTGKVADLEQKKLTTLENDEKNIEIEIKKIITTISNSANDYADVISFGDPYDIYNAEMEHQINKDAFDNIENKYMENLEQQQKCKEKIKKAIEDGNLKESGYNRTMNDFNYMVYGRDITEKESLETTENNLKCAVEISNSKESNFIKSSEIKKLLSTFQNLRKTHQIDNLKNKIPDEAADDQKQALETVYKIDFLEDYEMYARYFLNSHNSDIKKLEKSREKEDEFEEFKEKAKLKISSITDAIKKNKFKNNREDNTTKQETGIEQNSDSDSPYGDGDLPNINTNHKEENINPDIDLPNSNNENNLKKQKNNMSKKQTLQEKRTEQNQISNQIIDLIASTLRPKDESSGWSKENTYTYHYDKLREIMDEYMEDDDYYGSNSKDKNSIVKLMLKEKDESGSDKYVRTTCRFTYSLFAFLMFYIDENNNYSKKIFERDYPKMATEPLITNSEIGIEKIDVPENFKDVKKHFINFLTILKNQNELTKDDIEKLLKNFSDISGQRLTELFKLLCDGNEINPRHQDCTMYFDKLKKLKKSENIKQK